MTHSRRGSAADAAAESASAGAALSGAWLGSPPAAALSSHSSASGSSLAGQLSPDTPGTQALASFALQHPPLHPARGFSGAADHEYGEDLESHAALISSPAGSSSSSAPSAPSRCSSALTCALLLNVALLSLLVLLGQQLMEARAAGRWTMHPQSPPPPPLNLPTTAAMMIDAVPVPAPVAVPCIPVEAPAPAPAPAAVVVAPRPPPVATVAPEPAAAFDEPEDDGPSAEQLADAALPLPLATAGSSASSPRLHPLCTLYRFPRPAAGSFNASLFVTSTPNKGAGVGHQFGEWLYGVQAALLAGGSYLHSPFAQNSARWTYFLGFGVGEDSVLDWVAAFDPEAALRNDVGVWATMNSPPSSARDKALLRNVSELPGVEVFVRAQIEPTKSLPIPPLDYVARVYEVHRARALAEQRRAQAQGFVARPSALQVQLAPSVPRPLLVKFDLVHVLKPEIICEPAALTLTLRRKYCRARVASLLSPPGSPGGVSNVDHYAAHRQSGNHVIVALHLRCGDSCFDAYRTTAFASVSHSARRIHALLAEMEPGRPVAFHLFSQAPKAVDVNGTKIHTSADQHFAPLIREGLAGLLVSTHFSTGSSSTLHHLIRSDVLLGAQSSFSWLATILHHGVSLAPLRGCAHKVEYDKESGQFDEAAFKAQFQAAKQRRLPRFDSMDDCAAMQAHDEEAKNDGPAGEGLQWRPKPVRE